MKKILLILALLVTAITTSSAQRVRVMSYNVKNGMGVDGITSIECCSDVIRKVNPDVVAIQEVDSVNRRNNYYVLGRMAEQTGYHAYYGPTIKYRGG